jgi:tryptophanyl-tRNA synthetase
MKEEEFYSDSPLSKFCYLMDKKLREKSIFDYYDEAEKPGISNLLTIYATLKDISIKDAELEFLQSTYGTFKKAVADIVVATLTELQSKYQAVMTSGEVERVLEQGRLEASKLANTTLNRVKKAVGLV